MTNEELLKEILEILNDIDNLLKSGLIYKDNNEYLYFPLPIIPQWLSAEGLRLQYKSIDEIIKSEEQIIKWRYSLSILFGTPTTVLFVLLNNL